MTKLPKPGTLIELLRPEWVYVLQSPERVCSVDTFVAEVNYRSSIKLLTHGEHLVVVGCWHEERHSKVRVLALHPTHGSCAMSFSPSAWKNSIHKVDT